MTSLSAVTERFRASMTDGTAKKPMSSAIDGNNNLPRAAVLIGLFEHKDGVVHVLLSQRSHRLTSQPGEVALPGGKEDPTDKDIIDCALRESWEEVGLPREHVQVIGALGGAISRARLIVIPVVAVIPAPGSPNFPYRPSADEVDAVFSMPFEIFLSGTHHWQNTSDWNGMRFHLHHFHYYTPPSAYFITPGAEAHVPPSVTSLDTIELHPELSPSQHQQQRGAIEMGSRGWTCWGLTAFILIKAAQIAFARTPSFPVLPPTIAMNQHHDIHINSILKALSPNASRQPSSSSSSSSSSTSVAVNLSAGVAVPRSRL